MSERGGRETPVIFSAVLTIRCSERLMASEEEKLVVLRGIEAHLALCRANLNHIFETNELNNCISHRS